MTLNNDSDVVLAEWDVPLVDGGIFHINARAGEVVTVVGANGSGKSALITWMAARAPDERFRRMLAHRRLWFQAAGPDLSPAQRASAGSSVNRWDRQMTSRYVDHADGQRSSIALFDLLGAIGEENRRVVELYDAGANAAEVAVQTGPRLLPSMNSVLARSGLKIQLVLTAQQTFLAHHAALGVDYPIFQMSDGEKSALLLATEVLTAPPGTVIMIDEPERHLHRSISAGLIEAVVATRADCAFVVLTHDLDLASQLVDQPGPTLSISSVEWSNEEPQRWSMNEVLSGGDLPEAARHAVLGGRKQILFVEGEAESLDLSLYSVLFPEWSIVPTGSCDLVIRSVTGLRESSEHHWVSPLGLVDGDGRSSVERKSLEDRGIKVLPVSEIENLYYLPRIIGAVAAKQASTLGTGVEELVTKAKEMALADLAKAATLPRLARKLAKDEVARKLVAFMPDEVGVEDIEISFSSPYKNILGELEGMLKAQDYEGLIKAIPIRNTGLRNQVAMALNFRTLNDFQRAALVCITEDEALASFLRTKIGDPQLATAKNT